jgi:pantoate--beta-alanine ligase
MQIVYNKESLSDKIRGYKSSGNKITLIPTMGNLHLGHQALFSRAPSNTIKVATIYVNPLQFDKSDDYQNYPRSLQADLEMCRQNNIKLVYVPDGDISNEIVIEKNIDLPKFTRYLCGQKREGHFLGVYKVVKFLFSIVNPDFACFGKKDFQQLMLIKYLANTFFPSTHIIDVDTVRSPNNIALSSRLTRLSKESLSLASGIFETLQNMKLELLKGNSFDKLKEESIKYLESTDIHVEYLDLRSLITLEEASDNLKSCGIFIACYLDDVRLIDNIEI